MPLVSWVTVALLVAVAALDVPGALFEERPESGGVLSLLQEHAGAAAATGVTTNPPTVPVVAASTSPPAPTTADPPSPLPTTLPMTKASTTLAPATTTTLPEVDTTEIIESSLTFSGDEEPSTEVLDAVRSGIEAALELDDDDTVIITGVTAVEGTPAVLLQMRRVTIGWIISYIVEIFTPAGETAGTTADAAYSKLQSYVDDPTELQEAVVTSMADAGLNTTGVSLTAEEPTTPVPAPVTVAPSTPPAATIAPSTEPPTTEALTTAPSTLAPSTPAPSTPAPTAAEEPSKPTIIPKPGPGEFCFSICEASHRSSRKSRSCQEACQRSFSALKLILDVSCRGGVCNCGKRDTASSASFLELDEMTTEAEMENANLLQIRQQNVFVQDRTCMKKDRWCNSICTTAVCPMTMTSTFKQCHESCMDPTSHFSGLVTAYCSA